MEASLLIRLIDQVTAPAQKVRGALRGIKEGAREFGRGFGDEIRKGFSVENIEQATKNAEAALTKARGRLVGAFAMALTLGAPVKVAADFETAMNRVKALSNATGDEFDQLRKQALDLGRTTQFTASQAADAQGFLAMAGFKTNAILEAMPATLQLAASAQIDLAKAADIVTNVMTGYNQKGSELNHTNDVLVKAFTSANTDLIQLAEAMKYAGPVASAAGVDFEEATASLALMGNAGIQASMAGTGLRGAITRMLNPTKQMQKAMKAAGVSFTDSKGRLLPLVDIVRQLEPHADDAGLMMMLFGQRAGPAMMALISQGADGLEKLTKELENSGGTAERVSKVQMEGFNGMMKEFWSGVEGVAIALGTLLLPSLIEIGKYVTELVNKFTEFANQHPQLVGTSVKVVAALLAMSIGMRLLSFAFAGLRLPLIRLFGLFLRFDKQGRNVALGWRMLRGAASVLVSPLRLLRITAGGLVSVLTRLVGLKSAPGLLSWLTKLAALAGGLAAVKRAVNGMRVPGALPEAPTGAPSAAGKPEAAAPRKGGNFTLARTLGFILNGLGVVERFANLDDEIADSQKKIEAEMANGKGRAEAVSTVASEQSTDTVTLEKWFEDHVGSPRSWFGLDKPKDPQTATDEERDRRRVLDERSAALDAFLAGPQQPPSNPAIDNVLAGADKLANTSEQLQDAGRSVADGGQDAGGALRDGAAAIRQAASALSAAVAKLGNLKVNAQGSGSIGSTISDAKTGALHDGVF
jgi:TP901 family phage tail tape measure protein